MTDQERLDEIASLRCDIMTLANRILRQFKDTKFWTLAHISKFDSNNLLTHEVYFDNYGPGGVRFLFDECFGCVINDHLYDPVFDIMDEEEAARKKRYLEDLRKLAEKVDRETATKRFCLKTLLGVNTCCPIMKYATDTIAG